MTDDELIERLRRTLRHHASTVSSSHDAWDDHVHDGGDTIASGLHGRGPAWWLPAAVVAAAVAATALFVVVRSPSAHTSKVRFAASPPKATMTATVPTLSSRPPPTEASPAVSNVPKTGPPGESVPAGFSPVSVTFVSLRTGWVLGTAQCGSRRCTSLLRTVDGGATWAGIPAPGAPLSQGPGSPGVSHIRFANLEDGWAFDPQLWATHDGGAHWHQLTINGVQPGSAVVALEAAGGVVHADILGGPSLSMATSAVDTDGWAVAPTTVPVGAGPVPSAQLILQGGTGWLLEDDRTVVGGARLDHGRWVAWQPPCSKSNGPATLAASSATDVVAVCDEGQWGPPSPPATRVYLSSDGAVTFHQAATLPAEYSSLGVVASPAAGVIVVGTYRTATQASAPPAVLVASFDGGASWVSVATFEATGAWTDLGFTSPTQGVAVLASSPGSASGTLVMTTDSGHTWKPLAFHQAHL
jgi:hypothetical protein